jgi:cold shock CspA family protein
MWWLLRVIAGIFGIAAAILDLLRSEVGTERQRWETSFNQTEAEVIKYQQILNEQLAVAQQIYDFKKLTNLHFASIKVADSTHKLMHDAYKTLDAMGRAIVYAAKQRDGLVARRRHAKFWETGKIDAEIQSLYKLRNEILIPDKDRVKAERTRLHEEVKRLNNQTAQLRDMIRERCGRKGDEWYQALMARTQIRQQNKEREKLGLPPLPIPQSNLRLTAEHEAGIVDWYDSNRAFGFILSDIQGDKLHVSKKNLINVTTLRKGDRVEFIRKPGKEKGPWAAHVKKI